jgi:hypothetical protein
MEEGPLNLSKSSQSLGECSSPAERQGRGGTGRGRQWQRQRQEQRL